MSRYVLSVSWLIWGYTACRADIKSARFQVAQREQRVRKLLLWGYWACRSLSNWLTKSAAITSRCSYKWCNSDCSLAMHCCTCCRVESAFRIIGARICRVTFRKWYRIRYTGVSYRRWFLCCHYRGCCCYNLCRNRYPEGYLLGNPSGYRRIQSR